MGFESKSKESLMNESAIIRVKLRKRRKKISFRRSIRRMNQQQLKDIENFLNQKGSASSGQGTADPEIKEISENIDSFVNG